MILVSACLLGQNCKYNGGNNNNPKLQKLFKQEEIIPVCPEKLGGLAIPRPPAEIKGGRGEDVLRGQAKVVNKLGADITQEFIKGAQKTLKIAKQNDCKLAILKARSPSCGSQKIYDGSFVGEKKKGQGITAALLAQEGIKIINEEELNKLEE
ncbi:hypothetical protein Halha_0360 [Halobacteroides halobius DSM 5150]|uniref:Uncharacterized protein n=1 Tax=Halobacteroides halobius (strain ATCC 35273 / DSM 5150 / MD-1) TaxID=748449 RepID=L0K530_HALHC|nr:DUF523 domain-containing protein [Halobacteroides halobius]AGB40362.1 hypothetical protein Halha_0360 [Halobacteroides halobius DSM 5150]